MDAFVPGVPGWELAYDSPDFWHFRFHGPTPEALVQGREKIYFAYFWNDLAADKEHSLSESDRASYVAAYSRPGRMRAGWAYFASWPDTAKDFAQMAQTQLTMPVLSIAGRKSKRSDPRASDEAPRSRCQGDRFARHWPLANGRATPGNHGRACCISVMCASQACGALLFA